MTDFHFDFETGSEVDLPEVGLHNYATHPSTRVYLMGYAFGNNKPKVWAPYRDGEMPAEAREALLDPFVRKVAWNAPFERAILKYVLGTDVPICEFHDPMITARYLSMPGYLEDVGEILGLSPEEIKMSEGARLIKLFCTPAVKGGGMGLFGPIQAGFHDHNTDPEDWALFEEYVKRDVIAERTIDHKLRKFPLPESEYSAWLLDQKINERGIFCDMELVRGAKAIADRELLRLRTQLKELTGLENPNSNDQMLDWVKSQGYPFSGLGKAFVARAMAGEGELTPVCREVLEIRKMTSKTSVNKFDAILANVNSDNRIRHQFSFYGAPRTGRWSGKGSSGAGVQMQNLSKPNKAVEENMDEALDLIRKQDYDGIVAKFGQPLEVASSVIRGAFIASPGMKLVICDLNAIENRVLGWLAACLAILEVFLQNRDPYLDFAVDLYNQAYEELLHEYEVLKNKKKRNNSKPAVLGCGYQLGGGDEVITPEGDKIKTGLLGYAAMMGVDLTREEAHRGVQVFRKKFKEVVEYWYALEEASIKAVRTHKPQTVGKVTFEMVGSKVLHVLLPSGRHLHYINPEVEEDVEFTTTSECKGCAGAGCGKCDGTGQVTNTFKKDVLSYMGLDQKTRQWSRQHTRGGHLTENFCQAVARDVLLNGMILAEERGFKVIAHVHDEIVAEAPIDGDLGVDELAECMSAIPWWAEGLPLAAAGFESQYYRKD